MSGIIQLSSTCLQPTPDILLQSLGYPPHHHPATPLQETMDRAYRFYREDTRPRGMIKKTDPGQAEQLFQIEDRESSRIPLDRIIPRARHFSLFAFTLGEPVSDRINRLFESGDSPTATLLDRIASLACDRAGQILSRRLEREAGNDSPAGIPLRILLYSPGYCGWKLSAQHRLFDRLKPERIGIRLSETCLMIPLKSISGLFLGGDPRIHIFTPSYPFCKQCRDKTCLQRRQEMERRPNHNGGFYGNLN